jgi:ribosomal protein S18 acetylase RimI-like enzyme
MSAPGDDARARDSAVIVRSFAADEWALYRAIRLEALRDAPHAFGSTLTREEAFPDEEWITRLARGVASPLDLPLVAEADGSAVALAWARITAEGPETVTLYQFWVRPDLRRHGVGRRLVDAAVEWGNASGATEMVLSVALGPGSAIDFYRRVGFEPVGECSPLRPGSDVLQQGMRRAL